MENVVTRINNTKYIKVILCTLLCLTTFVMTIFIDYQNVHALLPALVIAGIAIPEAVEIVGGLLIAAGLTWGTIEGAKATAQWYYASQGENIRDTINNSISNAANGVATFSVDAWNSARGFVRSNFAVGSGSKTQNYYDAQVQTTYGGTVVTQYLPINFDTVKSDMTQIPVPIGTDFQIGNDVYHIGLADYIGANKNMYMTKNGVNLGLMSITVNTAIPWYVYLYWYNYGSVRLYVRYAGYNQTAWGSSDTNWYSFSGTNITIVTPKPSSGVIDYTGQANIADANYDIVDRNGNRAISIPQTETGMVNKVAEDVVTTTVVPVTPFSDSWEGSFRDCVATGAYVFQGTGAVTPSYDTEGTWAGSWSTNVQTGGRVWTGTYTGTAGTWTGTISEQVIDNRSFWQQLVDGLEAGLAGSLDTLKDAVNSIAKPIVDAVAGVASQVGAKAQDIINAISGVQSAVTEPDVTDTIKQYKIPDLFLLILKVILACIRLILRALVFIATLPLIAADAGDINSDFLSGVNFLKNQTIPHFGVSLWTLVSGVVAMFFGLAVVRRIRRLYQV